MKPLGVGYTAVMAVAAIGGFMFMSFAADLVFQLIHNSVSMPDGLAFDTPGKLVLGLIFIAALPAFIEETAFRGVILQGLRGLGYWPAVLISAALFALFHMNPAQTVYQFLLGIALAITVLETGSLFPGMAIHFLNNAFVILLTFFAPDFLAGAQNWLIFMLAGVTFIAGSGIIIGATILYRKVRGKLQDSSEDNGQWAMDNGQLKDKGNNCQLSIVNCQSKPGLFKRNEARLPFGAAMKKEHNTIFFGLAGVVIAAAMWIYIFTMGFFG